MCRLRPLVLFVLIGAATAAGCTKADSAQAGAADGQPKQVTVVPVKRDSVRRVGRRGRHPDRRRPGHGVVGSRRHRARHPGRSRRSRAGRAGARPARQRDGSSTRFSSSRPRSRARSRSTAPTDPQHLPGTGKYARRAERERRARAGAERVRPRAESSSSASSSRSRPSTTPRPSCRPSRRATKWRCRTPGI